MFRLMEIQVLKNILYNINLLSTQERNLARDAILHSSEQNNTKLMDQVLEYYMKAIRPPCKKTRDQKRLLRNF